MRDQLVDQQFRPIRALLRGLEALEALNSQDGLTVTEVAQHTRLPRTTAYRILETLCSGGFAQRDEADDRYRPLGRVNGLAEGYRDDGWIHQVGGPELETLCRSILWPLMLSTGVGDGGLRVRISTDHLSPFALGRYTPGQDISLTGSPSGVMHLARMREGDRKKALAAAAKSGASPQELSAAENAAHEAAMAGYALDLRPVHGEAGIALPLKSCASGTSGVVCMRFIRSALEPDDVLNTFLPQLRGAVSAIEAAMPHV